MPASCIFPATVRSRYITHGLPNGRMCVTRGCRPYRLKNGDEPPGGGVLFSVYTAYTAASAQNPGGKPESESPVCTRSKIVRILRSALPFWYDVFGHVTSRSTPCLNSSASTRWFTNSLPPSDHITLSVVSSR